MDYLGFAVLHCLNCLGLQVILGIVKCYHFLFFNEFDVSLVIVVC